MIEVIILTNVVIVRVKGILTDADMRTIKRLQAMYPNLEIRIIFDNALTANYKNNDDAEITESIEP